MSQIRTAFRLTAGQSQYDSATTNPALHQKHVFVPVNSDGSAVNVTATTSSPLVVTPILSTSVSSPANLVCATAGTAVQGSNVAATNGIQLVAKPTNIGAVYIGGNNVTNGSGNNCGIILTQAGMTSQLLPVSNLNTLWINADNNGDGVGVFVL
jgi:hypothetical protein